MRHLFLILIIVFVPARMWALDLSPLFVVEGDDYSEDLGYDVQSPGDLDGDGFSEVFVGNGQGIVKVFRGGDPPDSLPFKTFAGSRPMAWLDDLNGDQYKDFAVRRYHGTGLAETTFVDLYFGGPGFYFKTHPDISFWRTYNAENFGGGFWSEDVDGDNQNEFIIGALSGYPPVDGRFFIYKADSSLDSLADDTLIIPYRDNHECVAGACVGDINGDHFADYVISPWVNARPSYILIFFGGNPLDSIPDLKIWSPFPDAIGDGCFGESIIPLGDFNHDGYDDFAVNSPDYSTVIFYGGNPFDTIPRILQYPGNICNICGDINHDYWPDLAVGFTDLDYGSGAIFVYYGAYQMDTIADLYIPYALLKQYPHQFGRSVGSAGDFNRDGVDDLAVGAETSINPYYNKGYLFVFAGSDSLPTPVDDDGDGPIPLRLNVLDQNYPNPFNNQTVIEYDLWGVFEREVDLSIYNILGQKVRTLRSGLISGGRHTVFWDGTDGFGRPLPSGLYFYKLRSGEEELYKKMLYLK